MPNELTPPTKPKLRSLQTIAKNIRFMPYLIEGDIEEEDLDTEAGLRKVVENPDNFFVLLAPLKYKAYLNYENDNREPLDAIANRIMYVLAIVYGMVKDKDGQPVGVDTNEEGHIITPYGVMKGSLEYNMTQLVIFILTQHGRIVGFDDNGTFLCKRVTAEEIIDRLDPKAVQKTDENGQSLFMEILEISGVYVPEEVKADLVESGELEEAELPKPSRARKNGKSSMKEPS